MSSQNFNFLNYFLEQQLRFINRMSELYEQEIYNLNQVINNLPGSIYWKDKNGVYLGNNDYAADKMQLYQFMADSVVGKTDHDLFPKDVADSFRQNDVEVMVTGRELIKEESAQLPNGDLLIQLSSKRPLKDIKGEITGIVGNTVDITNIKKIEAELRIAKAKAEEADKAKTEFLQNMRHDIKTPLACVIGLANLLLPDEKDAKKNEILENIVKSSEQLLDFVTQILDFSNIAAGNIPIYQQIINVKQLLNENIQAFDASLNTKNLKLIININEDVPEYIISDRLRLQRILQNLITNAIKFTHEGHVTISVKNTRVENNQFALIIAISDTGIGIPLDKFDVIYDRFSRLSHSFQGVYEGTGLGLRIVKELLNDISGTIELQSQVGVGSTFICTIPVKVASSPNNNMSSSSTMNEKLTNMSEQDKQDLLKSLKILLVEDNAMVQYMMKHIIKNFGATLNIAGSGGIALENLEKNHFDIILLDIGLPDYDGIELAKKIRQELKLNIPIIAITAHETKDYSYECENIGINSIIEKPINLTEFRELILINCA